MTQTLAGILLPEDVLTSTWFITLATVVAFNTIVYMGLTLAKLIPSHASFTPVVFGVGWRWLEKK